MVARMPVSRMLALAVLLSSAASAASVATVRAVGDGLPRRASTRKPRDSYAGYAG